MKSKAICYLIGSLAITVLTIPGCLKTKVKSQLPPETQEGRYTIGFKVNGKVYTASGTNGLIATQYVSYNFITTDSSIYITASNKQSSTVPNFKLELGIKYSGSLGTYIVKNNSLRYGCVFEDYPNGTSSSGFIFNTSYSHTGKVTVKYFLGSYNPYRSGYILAGTFEVDAVSNDGKVIHITEGRFDIGK